MDVLANDIQSAWSQLLGVTSQFVIPDWGALIAVIPAILAVAVVLFYVWQIRRWATAGPTHTGMTPQPPVPPTGMHMPGPSFAPLFAAVGAFLLFFGIFVGGVALWLGLAALVATLLYWLREAVHEYESHVEATQVPVPLTGTAAPPPGIHIPAPSFRPILISLAAFVLFAGLVAGTAVFVAGLILLIGALLGWLRDARREFVATEVADRTGHLEAGPAPRFPTRSLLVGVVIVAIAVLIETGFFTSSSGGSATASGGPAASGGPGASVAPGGSPAASSGAGGSPAASTASADVTITAQGIAFTTKSAEAKAGAPFTIAFQNQDAGVPHNVDIKDSSGTSKFKGDIVSGVKTVVYKVPALSAGTYSFVCDVHPNMTGTLTVK